VAYVSWKWSGLGLDGVVRIDEMLMNFHFDDLAVRFPVRIPKYRVLFKDVRGTEEMELHPELTEIWVSESLRDRAYAAEGPVFEEALLLVMVRAEIVAEGRDPDDGTPDTVRRFKELARVVIAPAGS